MRVCVCLCVSVYICVCVSVCILYGPDRVKGCCNGMKGICGVLCETDTPSALHECLSSQSDSRLSPRSHYLSGRAALTEARGGEGIVEEGRGNQRNMEDRKEHTSELQSR